MLADISAALEAAEVLFPLEIPTSPAGSMGDSGGIAARRLANVSFMVPASNSHFRPEVVINNVRPSVCFRLVSDT